MEIEDRVIVREKRKIEVEDRVRARKKEIEGGVIVTKKEKLE